MCCWPAIPERADDDDVCLRARVANPPGGLDAVEFRHRDIHENDIGPQLLANRNGVAAVRRFANNLDSRTSAKEHPQGLAQNGMVISKHDASGFKAGVQIARHGILSRRSSASDPLAAESVAA